jgi:hypothetical protein
VDDLPARDEDTLLARIAAAADLAPTIGGGRGRVPVSIGGKTYDGIAAVPLAELALCSYVDYQAMKPAQRSHRSRRLTAAAKDGTLSSAEVQALQAKGVLPVPIGEEATS